MSKKMKNYVGVVACGGALVFLDEEGNVVETSVDSFGAFFKKLFARKDRTVAAKVSAAHNAA